MAWQQTQQAADRTAESFQGLLLRHRGRSGLTQRQLAVRVGVSRGSVQDWEAGLNYPDAQHLQALIVTFLEADGLTLGCEATEAEALWDAALRKAARMQTPFDAVWWARLLAMRGKSEKGESGQEAAASGEPSAGRISERRQDWGEAPDVLGFVGRAEELRTLREWVLGERCRLVAILGMGGIGKTAVAARLAQDLVPSFERLYWRSLRDALPIMEWLGGAISFLSGQQLVPPKGEAARLTVLLQLLRDRPCLLVLDNFETLLEPGDRDGRYRDGCAEYGKVLQAIGERRHQSCLVLTSREAAPELAVLGAAAVRRLELGGLAVAEGQVLLADKQLSGTTDEWADLISRFGGNGLALKVAGEGIRQVFGGDIGAFLAESGSGTVFGGIRRLLAEQHERSSAVEQNVLRVLAVEREPVKIAELIADLGPRVPRGAVLEAVDALRRRSLVERSPTDGVAAFTLQSVVLEYVTDRLAEGVSDEIAHRRPVQLVDQPLIKAQAKDYVRQTQERLIGEPILQQLQAQNGTGGAEQVLLQLLEGWRNRPQAEQGYGPGNVVNLLRMLRGDLRGLDLGHLALRQAYLAVVEAQDASLVGAHLSESVLAEAFNFPLSVALSGDGASLVAGTSAGEVWLWRVVDRTPLLVVQGHTGAVHGVALSADGRLVASGALDGTVLLWEAPSGRLLATLQGHNSGIRGVALSADGHLVASGSEDGMVRLWEAPNGRPLATLLGHTSGVRDVALSADGHLLASGALDGTVRLWEAPSGRPLATLKGHTSGVRGVALSPDGRLLASGGLDGTVRLCEVPSGRLLAVQEHTGPVYGVALSADGRLLASGSEDGTVRLWEGPFAEAARGERLPARRAEVGDSAAEPPSGGRLLATLHGHTGLVDGVALSPDGRLLGSGSWDGTVRLWDAVSGRRLATLQGHTSGVRGVALSPDARLLASGWLDGTVRLWDAPSGLPLATLHGHTGPVHDVALSPAGLLASGSWDGTVRLWDAPRGLALATLEGHSGPVYGVALSADGLLLASGSEDGTVRLWDAPFAELARSEQFAARRADVGDSAAAPPSGGRLLATLRGHTSGVWGVALSADGRLLASGGLDGTIRLWEAPSGRLLATLQGHTSGVRGVVLSADGRLLASGGLDGTIRLWEAPSGRMLATLQGHTSGVRGVTLSTDNRLLASCSFDGTVRLWAVPDGLPLAILQGHTGAVYGLALAADGQVLASGSEDGTIRLWEVCSGKCLRTVRSDRRYERLDITGLTGVTAAQRAALLTLGAVNHEPDSQLASAKNGFVRSVYSAGRNAQTIGL